MADTKRKSNGGPPDINGIEAELKSYWAERNSLIDEMEALRFMGNKIEHQDTIKVEEVRTSIAYSIVERVTGMLTDNPRTCSVPPAAETQKAKDNSEKIEKFCPVALDEIARISEEEPDARMIENLVATGHGCTKLVYAPQRWRGYPRKAKDQSDDDYNKATEQWKKGCPLPVSWASIDPRTALPRWDELGLAMILEADERSLIDLHPDRYNLAKEHPELWEFDRLKGGLSTVHFSQLWTRDTLTYAVDGKIVHHQRHTYGAPPYVYAMGTTTSSPKPARRGLSLLYPLRYMLPYLDRLLSQKGTAVRLWCWPTPVIKHSLEVLRLHPSQVQPPHYDLRPGKVLDLWGDEEITFVTWAGNGPDADEQLRLIMQLCERAGLADVLYGQGVGAGDSGYLVNQLISAARMKLRPIVRHAAIAMERVICLLLDVIELQAKQTLHVYEYVGKSQQTDEHKGGWVSLGPDDIQGYRQVRVELLPKMPTDEYAVANMAAMLKDKRIWSRERAMQRTGVEQPEQEKKIIMLEEYMDSPAVQQPILQEAVKRYGFKIATPEPSPAEVLQQISEPGTPSGLQQAAMRQMEGGAQVPGGQPQQQPDPVQVAVQMLQQGMTPDQVVQQLMAMGAPQQAAIQIVQQAMAMIQQQGMGGAPGPNAVMAAPGGVQAAPPPPTPQGSMGLPVRPAGMATGMAPGVKMRGMEG